jgi:hypothetical protein
MHHFTVGTVGTENVDGLSELLALQYHILKYLSRRGKMNVASAEAM